MEIDVLNVVESILLLACLAIATALPLPKGSRVTIVRGMFERVGVGDLYIIFTAILMGAGVIGFAAAGLAPVIPSEPSTSSDLLGAVFTVSYICAVFGLANAIGAFRTFRTIRSATVVDRSTPIPSGVAITSGVARRADIDQYSAEHTGSDVLAYDYRELLLPMDDVAVETIERTGNYRSEVPFALEAAGRTIYIDPSEAWSGISGDTARACRIEDGDRATVVGTIKTRDDGKLWMDGDDGFLYVTNETPSELNARFWRAMYVGAPLGSIFLTISIMSLYILIV